MVKRYWVIDRHRERKFGPHNTKRTAERTEAMVRAIPDRCLSISTVMVIDEIDDWWTMFKDLPVGCMNTVRRENSRVK